MKSQTNSTLIKTWKEQIRQVAARNPRLARQLWQNRQVYFDRFAHFYRQLANLPRKFRHKFLKRLATTLASAALLLTLGRALPAHAATITVDGVTCSLTDAITSANADTATGGCVAGSGADVIDLQTDVTLSAALPLVSSPITLEGNGHTLDGNDSFQVFYVQASSSLTLNNAIITGGHTSGSGGGIRNSGTLTVTNSTISNSSAVFGSGIFNGGTVTLDNSTLSGNSATFSGGGLHNFNGEVTLNNTSISDNEVNGYGGGGGIYNNGGAVTLNNSTLNSNSSSSNGGGIRNNGTLTLTNSTLSGNTADFSSGGIHNTSTGVAMLIRSTLSDNTAYEGGGGIRNSGMLTLTNSTLSGNTAFFGGGILNYFGGTVTLDNSTLTGNSASSVGGGLYNDDTVMLNRSLISGNQASDGAEIYNINAAMVNADNYNVVGYGGDARSYGFTPGANDIIPPGAQNTVLDTTLANNGGSTFTHALVSGSVAVDAGPDGDCTVPPIYGVDQRGYPRNVDGDGNPSSNECDSGAFEYASALATPTPTPTNTLIPTSTSTPTTTPTVTPISTNTPTPTNMPDPESKVYLPLVLRQDGTQATTSQSQATNPLLNFVVITLLTLGNLLFFRNMKA